MKKFITVFALCVFMINTLPLTSAHARGGVIARIIKSITEFFRGSTTKVDDVFKGINKSPDEILKTTKNPGLEETALQKISSLDERFVIQSVGIEKHQQNHLNFLRFGREKIKKFDRIWKELREEGVEELVEYISEEAAEESISVMSINNDFYTFVIPNWTGRIYRSRYFSKPEFEDKTMLICKTQYEVFYFEIYMEKKMFRALLTDHQFAKSSGFSSGSILPAQELFVLADEDEFKIMSTAPEKGYHYPRHYFTIYNNQAFGYDKRLSGTESPQYIFNKAQSKRHSKDNRCYKATKEGLFKSN